MYYALTGYLVFYSFLHSLLADNKLIIKYYYKWWYRFTYVILSVILLIPIIVIYRNTEDRYFFNPGVVGKILFCLLWVIGLYIGYLASKEYDNSSFLGLKQVKDYFQKKIKENKEFYSLKTTGLLGIVRHPYYLSALILLWARPMYIKDLIINIVFTIYFITGALNEERKLVGIFNDEYISYRRNVPMLIPDIKELVIFLVKNIKNPRHQKESEDL